MTQDERADALLDALELNPGRRVRDLRTLEPYAGCQTDSGRDSLIREDLTKLVRAGDVEVREEAEGTGGRGKRHLLYYVYGDAPPEAPDPAPEEAAPPPAEPWTLEELLYWLATSEESPSLCLVARAFEASRRKAVEAVRVAIDQRDQRLKGN